MPFRKPPIHKYENNLCPAGCHPARCIGVVDLGVQEEEWKGEVKDKQKVLIFWEFPTLIREWEKDGVKFDGPHMLSKQLTYSFADTANLTQILEDWRAKPLTHEERDTFDLHSVLGAPCSIVVSQEAKKDGSGDTAKIKNVMKLMPVHADIPEAILPLMYYNMPEHGSHLPKELPDWAVKIIHGSKEYHMYAGPEEPTVKPWEDATHEEKIVHHVERAGAKATPHGGPYVAGEVSTTKEAPVDFGDDDIPF